MTDLGRLLTAMVTPLHGDGGLAVDQAKRLAAALLESGSDGLVICGTTGESPTLSWDEEMILFRELLPVVHARGGALVAGTGSNSTQEAIEASREAEAIGVDALLLVVPYYNKPSQEGLFQHFRAVAEAVRTPCILYNVPSRTGTNMTAETQLRLAEVANIAGTKEASGDLEQIAQIIDGAPPGFRVWSGNDNDTLPVLALGGYGAVSVAAHIVGRQIRAMITAYLRGEQEEAAAIHRRLVPLTKALFLVGNPVPVKYALNVLGFPAGTPRLPLVEPDEATAAQIRAALARVQVDLPISV